MGPYPELPIITLDPPPEERKTRAEKYGSFFYLSIAGLCVLVALIAWFGWTAWSLRSIWSNVYRLHDTRLPEPARVAAALALARDRRYADAQALEVCLEPGLPARARYALAERLRGEVVSIDPQGYVQLLQDKTPPSWLRVLLARPLAYAAISGVPLPLKGTEELASAAAPEIGVWAAAGLALARNSKEDRERVAGWAGGGSQLACAPVAAKLLEAIDAGPGGREPMLDAATALIRTTSPEARAVLAAPAQGEEKAPR